jgi:hypothetical protein
VHLEKKSFIHLAADFVLLTTLHSAKIRPGKKKTLIIIAQRLNNQNMYVRVISKETKTQHQNPEFGHTQGEIRKKHCKKYISIQLGMKLRIPSILVIN